MNNRFIYLTEKYFSGDLDENEKNELNHLIENNEKLKGEFEEQKKTKEILAKMKLKNPSEEVWDKYWEGIYNRLERGIAWIIISIGAILVLGYSAFESLEKLFTDTQISPMLRIGILLLVFGGIILIVSLIREKFFKIKNNKYKEIQR